MQKKTESKPAPLSVGRQILRSAANVTEGFAMLAGIGTLLAFGARESVWLDNLCHFRAQYALALAAGCLIWLSRQKRIHLFLGAAILLWNLILLFPYLWPSGRTAHPGQPTLTVLLFNVRTENPAPEKVVAFLRETPSDVVVLEEINEEWVKILDPWAKQMAGRMEYPQDDNFGMGLYSRQRFAATKWEVASDPKTTPSLSACILFDGKPVNLLAIHPLPPGRDETWNLRNHQLGLAARWCAKQEDNAIVMGDLNLTPWSPFFRDFCRQARLDDPRRGRGIFPTWPSLTPLLLIPLDMILVQHKLQVTGIRRGPSLHSDHYPLIVQIQWNDCSSQK
ncbi:MAG: endonuclease/exonuclease/phosphatase family protein [Verrucomicrobiae bacterium]|nr:endonuclease/exonuclease/phosphatase family protein [Verrucomicrobiae bacterium]